MSKAGDDQRSAKRMVLARWSLRGLAFWMYNQTMFAMNRMTLRLIMPQWQGGNVHNHFFGSQRLAWLAPAASEIILGLGLRKRRQK